MIFLFFRYLESNWFNLHALNYCEGVFYILCIVGVLIPATVCIFFFFQILLDRFNLHSF